MSVPIGKTEVADAPRFLKTEQKIAVMRQVRIGNRNRKDDPVLWFNAYVDAQLGGYLVIVPWDQARRLIVDAGVYELKLLEGLAVIVSVVEGSSNAQFVRLAK